MKFLVPSRIDSLQLATKTITVCFYVKFTQTIEDWINVTTLQGTVRPYPTKPEVRKIIGLKSACWEGICDRSQEGKQSMEGGQTIHLTNSLKVIFLGLGLKSVFFVSFSPEVLSFTLARSALAPTVEHHPLKFATHFGGVFPGKKQWRPQKNKPKNPP